MPGGTSAKPNIVLALQVIDEARARDGISKITTASGQDDVEVTTKDGFAVITRKGAGSSLLSDLGKGSLAANPTFSGDMSALGDQGIASMWFDGKGFGEFAKNMGSASAGIDTAQLDGIGRAAVALRFNADYVELAGIGRGSKNLPDTPPMTGGAAALPDTTMLAWQSNGLGDAFGKAWPQLQKTIAGTRAGSDTLSGIEGQFGIKLPDDLQVLLGKSLTLSVPEQDFSKIGQSELPTIGARIVTTDAKRADEIVQGLVERGGVDNFVKRKVDGDKLFLATTDDYLGAIQQDGRLGATDAYKKAVADGDRATTAIFVNLDKLEPTYLKSVPGDYQEFVTSLSASPFPGTTRSSSRPSAPWASPARSAPTATRPTRCGSSATEASSLSRPPGFVPGDGLSWSRRGDASWRQYAGGPFTAVSGRWQACPPDDGGRVRPLLPRDRRVVPGVVLDAHGSAGRRVVGHQLRARRARRGADRLGQDPVGVPLGAGPAGQRTAAR